MPNLARPLLLFDIDGTLTKPMGVMEQEMADTLMHANKYFDIASIGGSDQAKLQRQLGPYARLFKYCFTENGTVTYDGDGNIIHKKSMTQLLGEEKFKELVNFSLRLVADQDIPVKRGLFFELRNGIVNLSPIGRLCTQQERDEFSAYNQKHKILESMAEALRERFGKDGLQISIGGQISMDIMPKGWDKTYSIPIIKEQLGYDDVHFLGDKIKEGGNDYEIGNDSRVKAHAVSKGVQETVSIVRQLIKEYKFE